MKQIAKNLIDFYIQAEKLKTTMRHSWTNDSTRQESTAEHSWMLTLIAMTLFEYLDTEVDQLKVLKILVIHDLAEAVTGDIPAFEISKRKTDKKQNELLALKKLTTSVSTKFRKETLELWNEYEERKTREGKLAHAIDKLEAALQHCISDISTWDKNDYSYHGAFYRYDYSTIDNPLIYLRDEIAKLSLDKLMTADKLDQLNETMQEIYKKFRNKI